MIFPFNIVESIVDNLVRDTVAHKDIKVGCPVYCELPLGLAEHSGVYIGNNQIAHLNRNGKIEAVSPYNFVLGADGELPYAMSIYVPCKGCICVGDKSIAKKAKSLIGTKRQYSLSFENCHMFTNECIDKKFKHQGCLFELKNNVKKVLGADTWRSWVWHN